jgi:hypothetical protein
MNGMAIHELRSLPDPDVVLTETDWDSLEHAFGPAGEAPGILAALLEAAPEVQARSLHYLDNVLHHQNTLYDATVPAALYVAAILPDPRAADTVDDERRPLPGPLRAHLLDWLDSVAHEVADEAESISRDHGFPLHDYAPAVHIQEIRPLLFQAAHAHTDDPALRVREAAISACMPLLDDPRLRHHRAALAPLVRDVLGTSARWQYRERAIDTLDAWGQDSSGIEGQQNPFEYCDSDRSSSPWPTDPRYANGFTEDPPF